MKKVLKFTKNEDALKFRKLLFDNGFECRVSCANELLCNESKYDEIVNFSLKYLNENLFLTIGDIYYYDNIDVSHNLDNKIFIELKLPNSRKLNLNYADDIRYPIDIALFLEKLEHNICTKLTSSYNEDNNSLLIEVGSKANLDVIKNKAQRFLSQYEYPNPFESITFYDEIKKEEKKEVSSLRSYFNKSILIEKITNPKKYENNFFNNLGYILEREKNSIRNINVTKVKGSKTLFWQEKIWGNFLLDEEKFYQSYKSFEPSTYWNRNEKITFTMLDNGDFISVIQVLNTESHPGVEITTNIDLIRNVVGYDFDGYSARDEIFKDVSHTDVRKHIIIEDYYYILNDPKVLIHFNSVNNDIDFYSKNNMYFLEDGIENEIKEITIPLEELENHEKYGIYYNEIAELIYSKKPSAKKLEKK